MAAAIRLYVGKNTGISRLALIRDTQILTEEFLYMYVYANDKKLEIKITTFRVHS